MPKKAVVHEQEYVVADDPVRLTVIVGERQYGSSMVFVGDDALANGDVSDLPLGEGKKLDGKTVVIYTIVTDIRDNTNEMSVTWILTGGRNRVTATETGSASRKFGSQMFKGVFHLTSRPSSD